MIEAMQFLHERYILKHSTLGDIIMCKTYKGKCLFCQKLIEADIEYHTVSGKSTGSHILPGIITCPKCNKCFDTNKNKINDDK